MNKTSPEARKLPATKARADRANEQIQWAFVHTAEQARHGQPDDRHEDARFAP
jgi:hypothetical protein